MGKKRTRVMKNPAVVDVTRATRSVPQTTKFMLIAQAAGRCEFDGCNRYLFEHHVTHQAGIFGEAAHIVAFRLRGPRGDVDNPPPNIHALENLMLLCPTCHKKVDGDLAFTRDVLEKYKTFHEDRMRYLTGFAPERQTTALILKGKIGGQSVDIPSEDVIRATAPNYPRKDDIPTIDLTSFDDRNDLFYSLCAEKIRSEVRQLFAGGFRRGVPTHLSVFALAPIPLLVLLGTTLTSKIRTEVFQRHRDTEDWMWKTEGSPVEYAWKLKRKGTPGGPVALILSLSGKIDLKSLPPNVAEDGYLYELTLRSIAPNPTFLRLRQDLINFGEAYQRCLRTILAERGQVERIHLFPAIPAPVAVLCGRELLPKTDPILLVYDRVRGKGGYIPTIEVNTA